METFDQNVDELSAFRSQLEADRKAEMASYQPGMQERRTEDEALADPRMIALGKYLTEKSSDGNKDLFSNNLRLTEGRRVLRFDGLSMPRFVDTAVADNPRDQAAVALQHLNMFSAQPEMMAAVIPDALRDPKFAKLFDDALTVYDGDPETGDKGTDVSNAGFMWQMAAAPSTVLTIGLGALASAPAKVAAQGAMKSAFREALKKTAKVAFTKTGPVGAALSLEMEAAKNAVDIGAGKEGHSIGQFAGAAAAGYGVGAALGIGGEALIGAAKTGIYRARMAKLLNGTDAADAALDSKALGYLHLADAENAKNLGADKSWSAMREFLNKNGLEDVRLKMEQEAMQVGEGITASGSYSDGVINLAVGADKELGHEVIHAMRVRMDEGDWAKLVELPEVQKLLADESFAAKLTKAEEAIAKKEGRPADITPDMITEEAVATAMRETVSGEVPVKFTKFQQMREQFYRSVADMNPRSPMEVKKELQNGLLGARWRAQRINAIKNSVGLDRFAQMTEAAGSAELAHVQFAKEVDSHKLSLDAALITMERDGTYDAFMRHYGDDVKEVYAGFQDKDIHRASAALERLAVKGQESVDGLTTEAMGFAISDMDKKAAEEALMPRVTALRQKLNDINAEYAPGSEAGKAAKLSYEARVKAKAASMGVKKGESKDLARAAVDAELEVQRLADDVAKLRRPDALIADNQEFVARMEDALSRNDAKEAMLNVARIRTAMGEVSTKRGRTRYSINFGDSTKSVVDEYTVPKGTYVPGENVIEGSKGYKEGTVRMPNMSRIFSATDKDPIDLMFDVFSSESVQHELFENGTTKVVTHAEMQARADAMKLAEALDFNELAKVLGAKGKRMMDATQTVFVKYADAQAKADITRNVDDIMAADAMRRAYTEMQIRLEGGKSDTARALGIFRSAPKTDAEAATMIAKFAALDKDNALLFAQKFTDLLKSKGARVAANLVKKNRYELSKDMIMFTYRAGLMSGFKTFTRTATSSGIAPILNILETATGSLISQLKGGGEMQMGEAVVAAIATKNGLKDAIRHGYHVAEGSEHLNLVGVEEFALNPYQEAARRMGDSEWAPVVNYLGWIIGIPSRLAQAADQFGGTLLERQALSQIALRKARIVGKGDDAAVEKAFVDFLSNPSLSETEVKEMNRIKTNLLLRGDMTVVGRTVSNLAHEIPALQVIVPFIRTPDNIFKFIGTRNPVTALFFKEFRQSIMAGGAQQEQALGALALGSAFTFAAGVAYYNGYLTGRKPTTSYELTQWEAEGKQEYSWKIGDTWIGMRGLDPVAGIPMVVADTMQLFHKNFPDIGEDGTEVSRDMSDIFAAMTATVTSAMMSRSAGVPLLALSDAVDSGDSRQFYNILKGAAGGVVPTLASDVAAQFDPYRRETSSLLDAMYARIPGMKDDLPGKYDVLGRLVRQISTVPLIDMISPISIKQGGPTTPFEDSVVANKWNLSRAGRKVSIDGVPVDLSKIKGGYSNYVQMSGQIRIPAYGNATLHETLNAIVTGKSPLSNSYQAGTPGANGTQEALIRSVILQYRQAALSELVKTHPEVQAAYTSSAEEITKMLGEQQQ